MKKNTKKSLITNGIFAVAILLLFVTGAHTEVFGFMQRGFLQTGIMDPDLKTAAEVAEISEAESAVATEKLPLKKADYNLLMRDINGERVSLEQFKGKVIFLNIWATWCPPCIAEMPGINELYKDVKDDKVAFVMLSMDQDFQKAIAYRSKKDYGFDIYHPVAPLPAMYNTGAIPTTFVIDPEGNLVLTHQGMGDFDTAEFREFLRKLQ